MPSGVTLWSPRPVLGEGINEEGMIKIEVMKGWPDKEWSEVSI